jgi:hypothetical protein
MKATMLLVLTALLIPLAACKVQVPEKLANALADKISGKKTEQARQGGSGQQEPATQAYTRDVVHDIVTVKAGGYHYYTVTVTSRMEDARIVGRFTAAMTSPFSCSTAMHSRTGATTTKCPRTTTQER